jgi:hypothetical protein
MAMNTPSRKCTELQKMSKQQERRPDQLEKPWPDNYQILLESRGNETRTLSRR